MNLCRRKDHCAEKPDRVSTDAQNRQLKQLSIPVGWLVGWLWTKHHILLGPRRYFTSDPPLVEFSPYSKDGQGEGEAADIAHQPISQGIEPGTTESVDREQSL